jgi:hypothetical protein
MDGLLIKRGGSGGTDTSDATATADQVLEGVTAYIATGKVTGTFNHIKSPVVTESMPIMGIAASATIV